MSFQNLEVNYKDKIAVVTINRPENLNALNSQTISELNRCFLDLESNSNVRAIVLTGAGNKAFVAGADIKEFADFSEAEGKALAQEGQEKLGAIETAKLYDVNLIRYRDLYDMSCMDLNHEDLKKLLFDWDGEPEVSKKLQKYI